MSDAQKTVLFSIVAWVTEPKQTQLMSRGFDGDETRKAVEPAPLFQREATVAHKKTGNPVAVSVLGTARQWAVASATQVEAYPSADGTVLYFQPHLAASGTAAADLGL